MRGKGWEKIYRANSNQKKAGVVILIPDKTENTKYVTKDKLGHFIIIKSSMHQKDGTIRNISAETKRASPVKANLGNTASPTLLQLSEDANFKSFKGLVSSRVFKATRRVNCSQI